MAKGNLMNRRNFLKAAAGLGAAAAGIGLFSRFGGGKKTAPEARPKKAGPAPKPAEKKAAGGPAGPREVLTHFRQFIPTQKAVPALIRAFDCCQRAFQVPVDTARGMRTPFGTNEFFSSCITLSSYLRDPKSDPKHKSIHDAWLNEKNVRFVAGQRLGSFESDAQRAKAISVLSETSTGLLPAEKEHLLKFLSNFRAHYYSADRDKWAKAP